MDGLEIMGRAHTIEDLLAKARHAANIGDGPHTVLYAHEAVCAALAALGEDITRLRRDLAARP